MAPGALAQAAVPPATFLAIGDWGHGGRRKQTLVAAAMAAAAAEAGSRFVLSVGDNFYPHGVKTPDDPHWKTSFEDVYTAASLQTPWYAALGNHDHRGDPQAQIAYSELSDRWRMPKRYFKVAGAEVAMPNLDIFVLDTTPMLRGYGERFQALGRGRIPTGRADRQIRWFEEQLAASRAEWKVVVGHHPIFSGGHHGRTKELVERIKPLLEQYGVQAYLCGHDHALQHIQTGGVAYICTGAAASAGRVAHVDGMAFRGTRVGFAMFTLADNVLNLEFRDEMGRILYQAPLPRTAAG